MTFLIVAVTFALGTFVQAIAGFGSALIIMPILTQFIGVQTAASVMAIVGMSVTVVVLYQNRRGFRWKEATWLLSGAVVGIPLGALALIKLPAAPIVAILGLLLLAYGCYGLITTRRSSRGAEQPAPVHISTSKEKMVSSLVGFCAGLLGGAYGTDGPPLVIFGSVKRWPKDSFRSILQACFLVDGILILGCYIAGGLVTGGVFEYCLYGVPGMIFGLIAGTLLDRRINHALFHRILIWLILLLGAGLFAKSFFTQ
jgi:uncharacterized protein